VLIVVLALWLVAMSLVLRFMTVAGERRCPDCDGEVELFPNLRRCPDCSAVLPDGPASTAWHTDLDPVQALVSAVVQARLRGDRLRRSVAPVHHQRASSGSTRSANSRTLS
jgi:hypothetical protein